MEVFFAGVTVYDTHIKQLQQYLIIQRVVCVLADFYIVITSSNKKTTEDKRTKNEPRTHEYFCPRFRSDTNKRVCINKYRTIIQRHLTLCKISKFYNSFVKVFTTSANLNLIFSGKTTLKAKMKVVKVALLRLSLTVLFLLQVLVLTTTTSATATATGSSQRQQVVRRQQQQQQRKVSGKQIISISSNSVFSQRSSTSQSSNSIVSSIQGHNTERRSSMSLLLENKDIIGFHQKSTTTGRKKRYLMDKKKMKSKKKHDYEDDYYYNEKEDDEKDDTKEEDDEEDKAIQTVIDNLENFEGTRTTAPQHKQYPPTISPSVQQKETIPEPVAATTTTTNIPLQPFRISIDQQINENELRGALVEYLATTMMVSTTGTSSSNVTSSVTDSIQLIGSPANTISNTFHYNGTLEVVVTTPSSITTKAGTSSSNNDVWLLKQSLALQDIQSLLKSLNKYEWQSAPVPSMEFNRATVVFDNDSIIIDENDNDNDNTVSLNDENATSSSANSGISNSSSINYPISDFSDTQLSSPSNENVDSSNSNNQQINSTTATNPSDTTKDSSSSINTDETSNQEEANTSFIQSENFLWILISSIAFMILLFVLGCSFYYIHEKRRFKSEKYISVHELEEKARYIYDLDDIQSDGLFAPVDTNSNVSTTKNKKTQKHYSTDGEVRMGWSASSSSSSSSDSSTSSSNSSSNNKKKKPIFRLPDDPVYYLNTNDPRQIICTTTSGSTASQQQYHDTTTTVVKVLETNNDVDNDDAAASDDDVMTYHTSSAYSLAFQRISCISPLTRSSVTSTNNNNTNNITGSVTGSITGSSLKHDIYQRQYHGGSRRSRAVVRSVGSVSNNHYNDHGAIIPSITPSVTDNDSVTDIVSLQGMNNTGRSARSTHWDTMSNPSDCSDIISTSSKSDGVQLRDNIGTIAATTNDDSNYINTNTNIYHFTKATLVSNTNTNTNILSSALSSPASTISLATSSCRRKSSSVSFSSTPKQQKQKQSQSQKENATNGIYGLISTPEQSLFAFNDDAGSTISSIHLPPSVH